MKERASYMVMGMAFRISQYAQLLSNGLISQRDSPQLLPEAVYCTVGLSSCATGSEGC